MADPKRPSFSPGERLTARDLNRVVGLTRTVRGGPGTTSSGTGADVVVTPTRPGPFPKRTFFARITDSFEIASNQWAYSWEEVAKTDRGYANWTTKQRGRSGMWFRDDAAFNFAEDMNGFQGVQGSGINVDNLPGTFKPVPCPDGQIVLMTVVRLADGTGYEYWFHFAGNVDGSCNA